MNGQRIIYSATGGTVIGGLVNGEEYYVIAVDDQTLQLAAMPGGTAIDLTSTGAGSQQLRQTVEFGATNQIAVDIPLNLIHLGSAHGLTDGDLVEYRAGQNQPIGGLNSNSRYLVRVIDADTIQLLDVAGEVIDLTSDAEGGHTLQQISVVTVSVDGTGGTGGTGGASDISGVDINNNRLVG